MTRRTVSLGKTNSAILNGEIDLREWTDEELRRGQRKDKNGRWNGSAPLVVPAVIHHEIVRRQMDAAARVIRDSVVDAVTLWADVVRDPQADMKYRLEASKLIAHHGLPKDAIRVEVAVAAPWENAIAHAIVAIPEDVIEAYTVDDDDTELYALDEGE